jgi:hypothetical protein
MQDLVTLIEQHDGLDALADSLLRTARSTRAGPAECAIGVVALQDALAAHVRAEGDLLYDLPGGRAMLACERMGSANFSGLDTPLQDYVTRWDVDAIAADRSAFAQQTGDLMTALKARIDHENRQLFPRALAAGKIALRRAG